MYSPRLWHSQTLRTPRAKEWAYFNHGLGQKDQRKREAHLTQRDVQWILEEEHDETRLIKYCPAPVSGGRPRPGRWLIRQGDYITLPELFAFGAYRCTCWDLYRTYRSLEIFIDKKPHHRSHTDHGIMRQNAKRKRYLEEGRRGLD